VFGVIEGQLLFCLILLDTGCILRIQLVESFHEIFSLLDKLINQTLVIIHYPILSQQFNLQTLDLSLNPVKFRSVVSSLRLNFLHYR
jgi:hypothetical protein